MKARPAHPARRQLQLPGCRLPASHLRPAKPEFIPAVLPDSGSLELSEISHGEGFGPTGTVRPTGSASRTPASLMATATIRPPAQPLAAHTCPPRAADAAAAPFAAADAAAAVA